jgi:hypothetical protein
MEPRRRPWFARAGPSRSSARWRFGGKGALVDGGGDGMIDCLTGKLKTIVIDNW